MNEFFGGINDKLKEIINFQNLLQPYYQKFLDANILAQIIILLFLLIVIPLGTLSLIKRLIKLFSLFVKIILAVILIYALTTILL